MKTLIQTINEAKSTDYFSTSGGNRNADWSNKRKTDFNKAMASISNYGGKGIEISIKPDGHFIVTSKRSNNEDQKTARSQSFNVDGHFDDDDVLHIDDIKLGNALPSSIAADIEKSLKRNIKDIGDISY